MTVDQAGLVAWAIFGWFAASVLWRRWQRRPLAARASPQAAFVERWASARFGSGLFARMATAKNCVQVQVVDGAIVVTPHFPFTLGFLPEVYGYDRRIPLAAVRSVRIMGRSGFGEVVEVRHAAAEDAGREDELQLLLRRAPAFVAAGAAAV
jgi:hypothetical protein